MYKTRVRYVQKTIIPFCLRAVNNMHYRLDTFNSRGIRNTNGVDRLISDIRDTKKYFH